MKVTIKGKEEGFLKKDLLAGLSHKTVCSSMPKLIAEERKKRSGFEKKLFTIYRHIAVELIEVKTFLGSGK